MKKIILLAIVALVSYIQCIYAGEMKMHEKVRSLKDPFVVALYKNNLDSVREFIKVDSNIVNELIDLRLGPVNSLYFAIDSESDTSIIQILLEAGVETSVVTYNQTPYEYNYYILINELGDKPIEYYKKVHNLILPYDLLKKKEYMKSPVWGYLENRDVKNVEKLLKSGLDPDIQNLQGEHPLEVAMKNLDVAMICMIRKYTNSWYNGYHKYFFKIRDNAISIKMKIEENDRTDFIKKLILEKRSMNDVDVNGNSKFINDIKNKIPYLRIIPYLQAGADPLAKDITGRYIWQIYGENSTEKQEKKKSFNKFIANYRKKPKLTLEYKSYIDPLLLSLKKLPKLSPQEYKKNQKNPIWKLIEKEDLNAIETWILKGGNVNLQAEDGETPIMKAIRKMNCEIVNLLLQSDVNLRCRTYKGSNPIEQVFEINELYLSNYISDLTALKLLLDKDDSKDFILNTTFLKKIKNGDNIYELKPFLDAGSDSNFKDSLGKTLEDLYFSENDRLNQERIQLKKDVEEFLKRKKKGDLGDLTRYLDYKDIKEIRRHQEAQLKTEKK